MKKDIEKKRTSVFLGVDKIHAIGYICFIEKKNQTEVLDDALEKLIKSWEIKNGPIPKPKK